MTSQVIAQHAGNDDAFRGFAWRNWTYSCEWRGVWNIRSQRDLARDETG